jgi:Uma2 family endonuclease
MRRVHYPYEDYLTLERYSLVRHEYLDGEIYAMAGGSPGHAGLAAAVIALIRGQLPAGCRIYTSDLRVRIQETGLSTYPDVTIVCGPTRRAQDDHDAMVNPVLLVEVTSESTDEYDRGSKLWHYQMLPTVQEILFVSHREPRLTLHRRNGTDWDVVDAGTGGRVYLGSVGATLDVDDVYRSALEDLP